MLLNMAQEQWDKENPAPAHDTASDAPAVVDGEAAGAGESIEMENLSGSKSLQSLMGLYAPGVRDKKVQLKEVREV